MNFALKIVMMVKKKAKNIKTVNVLSCIFYHN